MTTGLVVGVDGTFYVASDAGILYALDPRTGRSRWEYHAGAPLGSPVIKSVTDAGAGPALLPDGTILWPALGGDLLAINPNGRLVWTLRLTGQALSPTVVGGAAFYVADQSGAVSAYTVIAHQPTLRWRVSLGSRITGPLAAASDGSLRAAVDDAVVALVDEGTRARVVWRARPALGGPRSPAVGPDGVTVATTSLGHALGFGVGGDLTWNLDLGADSLSTAGVTARGLTYLGETSGTVSRASASAGVVTRRLVPASQADGSITSAIAVDGAGDVYAVTTTGHVLAWSGGGDNLFDIVVTRAALGWPTLAADGSLAVVSADGIVELLASPVG